MEFDEQLVLSNKNLGGSIMSTAAEIIQRVTDSVNRGNPISYSVDEIRNKGATIEIRHSRSTATISKEVYDKIKDYIR